MVIDHDSSDAEEHLDFSKEANVEVEEVEVQFTSGNRSYAVLLDPGLVTAVVWDSQVAKWLKLADEAAVVELPQKPDDFVGPGFKQGFEVKRTNDKPVQTGVNNQVFVNFPDPNQPKKDRWLRITNAVIHQLVLRYRLDTMPKQEFEVAFPVRTKVEGGNVGTKWGDLPEETHIDMLWWDDELCAKVRREMERSDKKASKHWKRRVDGSHATENGKPESEMRARIPQHKRTVIATSNSKSCSFCYHFNNCEWACTGNFA